MPCYINIEDRYNCRSLKARQQFNVFAATATALGASAAVAGAIGAATVTSAVGAAATLGSSAMQANAAGKAAKGQAAAMKKARRQEKKAAKGFQMGAAQIESDLAQIPMPVRDPEANMREAERITGYNREQLNRFYGGQYKNLEDLAVRAINDRLSGQMTQAARGATMRESAYMQGAGFNPATARAGAIAQRGPFDYLRAIGQSAEQAVTQGFNMMGDWTRTAAGFIASPLEVSQDSLAYQMGAANVGIAKAGIRSDLLAAQYGAQTGQTTRGYERQLELEKTGLARGQAGAEGLAGAGGSLTTGLTTGFEAYNKYRTAQETSTTPMASGFYAGEIGAANAYGVAPSQLSYQKGTGGFLGIGGQGGGYYYTPGGVYGRT